MRGVFGSKPIVYIGFAGKDKPDLKLFLAPNYDACGRASWLLIERY